MKCYFHGNTGDFSNSQTFDSVNGVSWAFLCEKIISRGKIAQPVRGWSAALGKVMGGSVAPGKVTGGSMAAGKGTGDSGCGGSDGRVCGFWESDGRDCGCGESDGRVVQLN